LNKIHEGIIKVMA
jgi:hypothetical protein